MDKFQTILIGSKPFELSWLKGLESIKKSHIIIKDFEKLINENNKINCDWILPLSEIDYNLALEYSKIYLIEDKIIYPKKETIDLLHNKIKFNKFMLEHYPSNIPLIYWMEEKKYIEPKFPAIIKPNISVCGIGMKIIKNMDEYLNYLENPIKFYPPNSVNSIKMETLTKSNYILQEYIENEYEYSGYFLCIGGEIKTWKIIKQAFKGLFIKRHNFTNYINSMDVPIELFKNIIKKLNYSGGLCVDFKYHNSNIYIFEMNPRFGGSAFTQNFIYELLCIC